MSTKEKLKKISGKELFFEGIKKVNKGKITMKEFTYLCKTWLQIRSKIKKNY